MMGDGEDLVSKFAPPLMNACSRGLKLFQDLSVLRMILAQHVLPPIKAFVFGRTIQG